MLRRVWSVLLNYFTRPLMWVGMGFYVLFLILMVVSASQAQKQMQRSPAYPEISFRGKTLVLQDPQALHAFERGEIDPDTTTVVVRWPEFGVQHLVKLQSLPHLRALKFERNVYAEISNEEEQAIGELPQLQALSLAGCTLKPTLWRRLGQLPNLQYLDLSGCRLQGDYPGLESLAHLQTLVLGTRDRPGFIENGTRLLPELKRLPMLSRLVLGSEFPVPAGHTLAPPESDSMPPSSSRVAANPIVDGLNDLRAIPQLKLLFVDADAASFPGFESIQQALPRVRVRPAMIDTQRPLGFGALVFLNTLLLLMLGVQILSQFCHSGARLIPDYTVPHLIPPLLLWTCGQLANTIPFVVFEMPFLTALGLTLLPWPTLCGVCLLSLLLPTLSTGARRSLTFLIVVLAIGWTPFMAMFFEWNRSSVDWYFRGHEPGWAWLFVVCGIAAVAGSLWKLINIHAAYSELGVDSPPLSFDPAAIAIWQQQMLWRRRGAERESLPFGNWFSRRLASAIRNAKQANWRTRSKLWIVGNLGNVPLAMGLVAALAMAFCIWGVLRGTPIRDIMGLSGTLPLFMSVIALDLPMIAVAAWWRRRRSLFAIESLRPTSRLQFARQIAAAIAWDLLPLGIVYLAVLIWYTLQADPDRWSFGWTLAMLAYFVSRWAMVYGFMLWAIVIRRDWVLVLVQTICGYTTLAAYLAIVFLQAPMFGNSDIPSDWPHVGVWQLSGMALLLGGIACANAKLAYWRWQTIELP